jgi:hypothetical protein
MCENKPMTILNLRITHVPMLLKLKVSTHSNFKQGVYQVIIYYTTITIKYPILLLSNVKKSTFFFIVCSFFASLMQS